MWSCLKLAALSSNASTFFDLYIWYFVVETLNMQYCIHLAGSCLMVAAGFAIALKCFRLNFLIWDKLKLWGFLIHWIYIVQKCAWYFSLFPDHFTFWRRCREPGCSFCSAASRLQVGSKLESEIYNLERFHHICSYLCLHLNIATT